MAKTSLEPAEALKLFARQGIKVQEATRVKVKDKETGKERSAFETKDAQLTEAHIIGAAQYDDGRATIVTIDGKRHEVQRAARQERNEARA